MKLNGSWIRYNRNTYKFIFWGEHGETQYKKKGRTPKNALPLYDEMSSLKEVESKLNLKGLQIRCGKYKYDSVEKELVKREIRGIVFDEIDALKILLNLENRVKEINELELSDEIQFWILAARLTVDLIIKHNYMPSLMADKIKRQVISKWKWHTGEKEYIEKIKKISRNMPPSCRSYFSLDDEGFEYTKAPYLLTNFIDTMINKMVRGSNTQVKIDTAEDDDYLGYILNGLGSSWIDSLFSDSGEILTNLEDQMKIVSEYKKWIEPIRIKTINSKFRTCFKVVPPTEDGQWSIEYLLQAKEEPSLMLPAKVIFRETKDTMTFLNKRFENPQERLLEDLGSASRIFIPFERSLYEAAPTECKLSSEELYIFLNKSAGRLKEKGFGIMAPSWWKNRTRFSFELRSKSNPIVNSNVAESTFKLDTILNYNWKVSLDGEEISDEEFERLSRLKVPIVQLRGKWVEVDIHQIKALKDMKNDKNSKSKLSAGELLRLSLGEEEIVPGVKIDNVVNREVVQDFLDKLLNNNKIEELEAPKGFKGTLREYQKRGFSWLAFLRTHNMGACLADDMGLGKTIQTICLMLYEREQKLSDKPMLLICPTSIVGNWKREIEKFAPSLKVMIHHGSNRCSAEKFPMAIKKNDVIITTYSLVVRDNYLMLHEDWAGIILDEAQNIKNTSTKQTQHIKKLKGEYKIALTGTPVENRLSDLWSIMDFLNKGYLFTWTKFRNEFAVPIERNGDSEKGIKLRNIISPFVLRRVKTDSNIIKDLPEKIETKEYAPLTKEQVTLYEAVVQDCLNRIGNSEGIERKGLVLSALTKFKQICNHPVQFLKDDSTVEGRSGKLTRLLEMLEETSSEGDRALVFTQFAEMGNILRDEIEKQLGIKTLFLYGGTSRKKREEMIEAFQSEGDEPMVFILSLKAGGVGLNLTKANHVFHFDRWWNPAVENQATDRAFRIGQKKNVHVHKFICMGTLEEKIDEMIEKKKALAETIVSTSENWISEMSNEELKELFSLEM